MVVGGNIEGFTRVMTTAIALETSKGDLPLALALGCMLMAIVLAVNLAAQALRGARRPGGRLMRPPGTALPLLAEAAGLCRRRGRHPAGGVADGSRPGRRPAGHRPERRREIRAAAAVARAAGADRGAGPLGGRRAGRAVAGAAEPWCSSGR